MEFSTTQGNGRQQWESSADRRNESDVARILESKWSCRLHKLPKSYRMDYIATRQGKPVAFVEVKCRTISSTQFSTVMLSLSKYMSGKTATETTGIPSFVVFRFTDCMQYASLLNDYPIRIGGRTVQTRDGRDLEPVIEIPAERMETL